MGGTFRFNKPIRLYQKNGQEILVTEEDAQRNRDHLEGVPIF
jgi:hypothetical protein